ncbi:MAG: hypothetical protein CM1200mP29_10470 [Verrucomicrobiota bacterium]|nr:MAG: hypothetical protein CM1200mP29_10470 [Verrucomicrobiota bacterium]
MNGIIRTVVMMPPLANPTSPPISTVKTAPHKAMALLDQPGCHHAAQGDDRPGLRSMPPLKITIVMPIAPKATMTVCVRMVLKLPP